jgi:Flp pilus assembly protein TadD
MTPGAAGTAPANDNGKNGSPALSQSMPPFEFASSAAELFRQGVRSHQSGRLDEAETAYRQVLAIEPTHTDALHLLGLSLHQRQQHEAGLDYIGRAIQLRGDRPHYYSNAAITLQMLGRLDEAEACCRAALHLKPDYLVAHNNLGLILRQAARFEEAEAAYRAALRHKPDFAEAYNNLGNVLCQSGRHAEAEPAYRAALHLPAAPGLHDEAAYNLSLLLLVTGRLEEGWQHYERRFGRGGEVIRPFAVPMWDGKPAPDRVLLIHAEQGLGDTLQFCRYAPLVARSIRVVFEVQPALHRLLSNLPGIAQTIAYGDPLPAHDFHCPLLSIPRLVGTRVETIPGETPYLAADPALAGVWKQRLSALDGVKVGLVWAGKIYEKGQSAGGRDRRSIALDQLAPLAATDGVSFVSLQLGPSAAQAAHPPKGMILHDFTTAIMDFADTAAVIANLDLVIAVDTSVAHLAGALGKPVFLLNRFDTCWRWLLDRDDSPWYPTLRQFRQKTLGDWAGVVAELHQALTDFVRDRR